MYLQRPQYRQLHGQDNVSDMSDIRCLQSHSGLNSINVHSKPVISIKTDIASYQLTPRPEDYSQHTIAALLDRYGCTSSYGTEQLQVRDYQNHRSSGYVRLHSCCIVYALISSKKHLQVGTSICHRLLLQFLFCVAWRISFAFSISSNDRNIHLQRLFPCFVPCVNRLV